MIDMPKLRESIRIKKFEVSFEIEVKRDGQKTRYSEITVGLNRENAIKKALKTIKRGARGLHGSAESVKIKLLRAEEISHG